MMPCLLTEGIGLKWGEEKSVPFGQDGVEN